MSYKRLPFGLKLATPSINCPSTESSSSSCWWISSILNTKQYRTRINVRYSAVFCKRLLTKSSISKRSYAQQFNSSHARFWLDGAIASSLTMNRIVSFESPLRNKKKSANKNWMSYWLIFTFLLSHPFLLGVFQYHQAFLNLVRRKSVG